MSDDHRKDFSQKAKEDMIPDSSKSTGEKMKEKVTNAYDKVAGKAQPDETKSTSQRAYDNAHNN